MEAEQQTLMQRSFVDAVEIRMSVCCSKCTVVPSYTYGHNKADLLLINKGLEVFAEYLTSVLQDWLTESAKLISKSGHTVEWVTPLGLPIIQPYHRVRNQVVSPILRHVGVLCWSLEVKF